jgi:hypothetical protein
MDGVVGAIHHLDVQSVNVFGVTTHPTYSRFYIRIF